MSDFDSNYGADNDNDKHNDYENEYDYEPFSLWESLGKASISPLICGSKSVAESPDGSQGVVASPVISDDPTMESPSGSVVFRVEERRFKVCEVRCLYHNKYVRISLT